jgi:hypothetical protein
MCNCSEGYEGNPYLDIRIFASDSDGKALPTKAGLTVGLRMLPQFVADVAAARAKAAELGLLAVSS